MIVKVKYETQRHEAPRGGMIAASEKIRLKEFSSFSMAEKFCREETTSVTEVYVLEIVVR